MKIAVVGFEVAWGKFKYQDSRLLSLEKKVSPKKTHTFFVEFIPEIEKAEAIICSRGKSLDLFIPDLEIVERRLNSSENLEKELLKKCSSFLEKEIPLSQGDFSLSELNFLRNLGFLTVKPTLILENFPSDINQLIGEIFNKAGLIFFYTLAKGELKSWLIKTNTPIVEAAGKIHSDLARGFIKAEVVNFEDFLKVHNWEEARKKGFLKVVGKDYIVKDGDILEIKFKA